MPDEFVGSQLIKRHQPPGESGRLRGDEDLKTLKAKWQNILPPPEEIEGGYKGINWGGGENILDLWEKSRETTDPEFQLLMKSFLLESYGVRSLKELEIFAKEEEGNFSSFKSKCQRIGELFGGKEGRVINFWVKNLENFRRDEIKNEETTTKGYFKPRFLEWLGQKEPSEKGSWVSPEKILEKITPYLQDEERLSEAERKKRGEVILRCQLEKIEDLDERRRMATWVKAWQGEFGRVQRMAFNYNPRGGDLDRIARVVLEVGEDERRRFFAVKFDTFCAAFGGDGFKPAGLKLEPKVNGEKLWRYWRITPFVILEKGEPLDNQPAIKVKTAYTPFGNCRAVLERKTSSGERNLTHN